LDVTGELGRSAPVRRDLVLGALRRRPELLERLPARDCGMPLLIEAGLRLIERRLRRLYVVPELNDRLVLGFEARTQAFNLLAQRRAGRALGLQRALRFRLGGSRLHLRLDLRLERRALSGGLGFRSRDPRQVENDVFERLAGIAARQRGFE